MHLGIRPLNIKDTLESKPLNSILLVCELTGLSIHYPPKGDPGKGVT